jgi:hypothetical protein
MGEGGVSVKLDVNQMVNKVADYWFELFRSDVKIDMPEPASVFPAAWDAQKIQMAREQSYPSHSQLRWNQAQRMTDTAWLYKYATHKLEWDLGVHWDGLTYVEGDETYWLLDNARATCTLLRAAEGMSLFVWASFGHPNLFNHVAALPVWFRVQVKSGDDTIRDEQKGFTISAEGSRGHL